MGVSEELDFDDALFIIDVGERGLIHRNILYPDGERALISKVKLQILYINSIDVDEESLRSDHLSLLYFAIVPLRKSRV